MEEQLVGHLLMDLRLPFLYFTNKKSTSYLKNRIKHKIKNSNREYSSVKLSIFSIFKSSFND